LKSYLWVADPRQVTFLCLSKEKSPKETTPRSARLIPLFLASPGARQLAGRTRRASGSNTGSLEYSRWGGGTRRALRGPEKTCCSIPPAGMARVGVLKTPSERAEHRARPGVFARLLIEPEARCSAPGELGERPAAARRAGNRPVFGRRSDRAAFSFVAFFWLNKRKPPRVQGRSHPQIAVDRGRRPLDLPPPPEVP
jgi:hypothetical protein